MKAQFTCADGSCINITHRCDDVFHCPDKSDEKNCHKLMIDKTEYRISSKPPPSRGKRNLPLRVTIYVTNVDKVQELESDYRISFWLMVSWHDSRLSYQNLREDERQNILTSEEAESVWTPQLHFPNSYGKNPVGLQSNNAQIFVRKNAEMKGSVTSTKERDEGIHYQGKDHFINLFQRFQFHHHCTFNLRLYPFDQQVCPLTVITSKTYFQMANTYNHVSFSS